MKAFISIVLTLIAVTFAGIRAQATSPAPAKYIAGLEAYQLHVNNQKPNMKYSGSVSVDFFNGVVNLEVLAAPICREGFVCTLGMYNVFNIQSLPIKAVKQLDCGVIQITAERNELPVDGIKQLIEIYDYSKFSCARMQVRGGIEKYPTLVRYELSYYNRMVGELLVEQNFMYGNLFVAFQ